MQKTKTAADKRLDPGASEEGVQSRTLGRKEHPQPKGAADYIDLGKHQIEPTTPNLEAAGRAEDP